MDETTRTDTKVLIFDTTAELYSEAATALQQLADEAIAARDRFLLVLSGGETSLPLYQRLANEPVHASFPWQQTHVFWGDERAVSPEDPMSNYGMARTHLLEAVPLPEANVHRIIGEVTAATAAREYSRVLQKMAGGGRAWPRFDVVLLGLGADGHTASLFPGSMHPARSGQATLAVTGSYDQRPTSRVTLTPPVFNSARSIFFLVTGERKAETLANVLEGDSSPVRYPARRIKPPRGTVTWFVDGAAASRLQQYQK